jgi:hypothetical protein
MAMSRGRALWSVFFTPTAIPQDSNNHACETYEKAGGEGIAEYCQG